MEHLRSLTETGGVVLARNDADLLAHVLESLADRDRNSANRACLRALHLDPLDGRAAERLVAAIVREAGTTRVSQAYAAGAL